MVWAARSRPPAAAAPQQQLCACARGMLFSLVSCPRILHLGLVLSVLRSRTGQVFPKSDNGKRFGNSSCPEDRMAQYPLCL